MENMITKVCKRSKVSDIDSAKGILTLAVNHIGNVDSQGDMSMSGSFDKTISENFDRVKWLYNHDTTVLLGCPISAEEKDNDLVVTGQINLQKQIGRDVFEDYKLFAENGKTLEHSVGVSAVKWKMVDKIRQVSEWKLWEYSTLAFLGSNPNTRLIDIKSATRENVIEQIDLLEKALKAKYSDERLKGMEEQLTLLRKAVGGELIVKCPHCGKEFDYNSVEEHTFQDQVLDVARYYLDSMIWSNVYGQMQEVADDVRGEVADVINAVKAHELDMTEKSITDLMAYVRCPECWSRVYKVDNIVKENEEKSLEPLMHSKSEPATSSSFFAGFGSK